MRKYSVSVSTVGILLCVLYVGSSVSINASQKIEGVQPTRKITIMPDVSIHLFDERIYREKVLPAFQTFFTTNDVEPLVSLLRECIQILDANPQLSDQLFWDKESCEEDIGILTGAVYYSPDNGKSSNQGASKTTIKVKREYVKGPLGSNILQVLCIPHDKGVRPDQDMSNTPLVQYLYKKSDWISDLFTFVRTVRGGRLKFAIGESSESFTKEDIQEFNSELNKIPPPGDSHLQKEYANLQELLKLALEDPDLTLVLSVK